jgi:hypothetical protein
MRGERQEQLAGYVHVIGRGAVVALRLAQEPAAVGKRLENAGCLERRRGSRRNRSRVTRRVSALVASRLPAVRVMRRLAWVPRRTGVIAAAAPAAAATSPAAASLAGPALSGRARAVARLPLATARVVGDTPAIGGGGRRSAQVRRLSVGLAVTFGPRFRAPDVAGSLLVRQRILAVSR